MSYGGIVNILMLWRKAISVRLAVALTNNFHVTVEKLMKQSNKVTTYFSYWWCFELTDLFYAEAVLL